jgi:hypothetical protein
MYANLLQWSAEGPKGWHFGKSWTDVATAQYVGPLLFLVGKVNGNEEELPDRYPRMQEDGNLDTFAISSVRQPRYPG